MISIRKLTFRITEIPGSGYDRSHCFDREGLRQEEHKFVEDRWHSLGWPNNTGGDQSRIKHSDCQHNGALFGVRNRRDQHAKTHATNAWRTED